MKTTSRILFDPISVLVLAATALMGSYFLPGIAGNSLPRFTSLDAQRVRATQSPISADYRAIEDLEVGDIVWAFDEATGEPTPGRVSNLFRNRADHLRVLSFADSAGDTQVIKTTDEHPFFVPGTGWTEAYLLRPGDSVQQVGGQRGTVTSSAREEHPEGIFVFNVEVEGPHTYYVSSQDGGVPIAVHNCNKAATGDGVPLRRPYLRKATRDAINAAAARAKNGKPIDPNTGKTINSKRHIGHKASHEHRRLVKEAEAKGMTQKQFNDWVNDHPEWFHLEDPKSNMSHAHELPGG